MQHQLNESKRCFKQLQDQVYQNMDEIWKGVDEIQKTDPNLASSDLIIGRSGAHTTYELAVLGKKCILVPFMHTHAHEQLHNAKLLEQSGLAIIIPESQLSFPRLVNSITSKLKQRHFTPLKLPLDATQVMIQDMIHVS